MTVKLIKRTEAADERDKHKQPASPRDMVETAQGWVEEYKARKAVDRQSLAALMRRA